MAGSVAWARLEPGSISVPINAAPAAQDISARRLRPEAAAGSIRDMESSVAPRDGAAKRSAEARRLRWSPVGARRVGGGRKCMQQRYLAVGHAQQQPGVFRSEEHTSELQSLMRISYAVFCLKKKTK